MSELPPGGGGGVVLLLRCPSTAKMPVAPLVCTFAGLCPLRLPIIVPYVGIHFGLPRHFHHVRHKHQVASLLAPVAKGQYMALIDEAHARRTVIQERGLQNLPTALPQILVMRRIPGTF